MNRDTNNIGQWFEQIDKITNHLVCILDAEKLIFRLVSLPFLELTNKNHAEIQNCQIWDFVFPSDLKQTKILFDLHQKEGNQFFDLAFRFNDWTGKTHWLDWNFQFLIDPKTYYCIVKDISEIVETRKELELNERRFRLLVDQSVDMIFLHDFEGNITAANQKAINHYGYSRMQFLSMNIRDLSPITHKAIYTSVFWEQIELNEPFIFETVHISRANIEFPIEAVITRVVINKQPYIMATFRDITSRKKTQQELIFHSILINHISDYVTATDLEGNITYVNQKVCNSFKKSKQELIGQHVSIYGEFPTNESVSQMDIVKKTIEKGNWEGEIINILPDNKHITLHCRTQLLTDEMDNPYGMIGISSDITERKMYEKVLQEKREELERQNEEYLTINEELNDNILKIKSINQELEDARKKAEESDRLKSAFLANMSHEIRTPLNGILGFTDLLASKQEIETAKKENYKNIIRKSAENLLNIINDILDISKIESGQLSIIKERFSVTFLLNSLFSYYQNKIVEINKSIELILEKPETDLLLFSDEYRIRQVMNNLIDNSIKFTAEGKIQFGVEIVDHNFIQFYVKDSGIGIPPSMIQLIFERFRQADDTHNRSFGGNGLGLTICKNLVELMGGKIWVESQEGLGSEFYFTIPIADQSTKTKIQEKQPQLVSELNHIDKILLVEDDEYSRLYMVELLNELDINYDIAETGEEAIRYINKNNYSIILIDIRLPDINGLEIVKKVREFNQKVYIIAQTAFAMQHDYDQSIAAGCNDYISKPISKKTLIYKINNLFKDKE